MTRTDGSTNEDIGRPGPWKEGRYQQPGQPIDQSDRLIRPTQQQRTSIRAHRPTVKGRHHPASFYT